MIEVLELRLLADIKQAKFELDKMNNAVAIGEHSVDHLINDGMEALRKLDAATALYHTLQEYKGRDEG